MKISDNLLKRINELAKKSREEGLTSEEKVEQQDLRQAYLKDFRESMRSQIESMTVIDPDGNDVTPDKIKDLKNK